MSDLQFHLKNLEKIILSSNEQVEGNIYCDGHPKEIIKEFQTKQLNLSLLAINSKKICEIGFNAGHSALFMLLSNPESDFLFFDLNYHRYTEPCFQYLQRYFPETNMEIIYGDSKKTLPKFVENNKEVFDLIHIDGGHDYETLNSDYKNSYLLCQKDGKIVIDDTDYSVIDDFYKKILQQKNMNEVVLLPTNLHRILQKI